MCQETADVFVEKLRALGLTSPDRGVIVCVDGRWYAVNPDMLAIPSRRVGLPAGAGSLPELPPAEGRPRTALSDSIGEPWP